MGKKSQKRREQKQLEEKERREIIRTLENRNNPFANIWRRVDLWVYLLCILAVFAFPFIKKDSIDLNDQIIMHTSMGDIEIDLYKDDAPKTVENFVGLIKNHYYDGLIWHRVIKGFMIQSGDPGGDGTGGESLWGEDFEDEINPASLGLTQSVISQYEQKGYNYNYKLKSHKVDVGSLAMANHGPNTNASQFFIVTEQPQPHLDGQHTVFGKVTKGLDIAVRISETAVDEEDKPIDPIYINSIELK